MPLLFHSPSPLNVCYVVGATVSVLKSAPHVTTRRVDCFHLAISFTFVAVSVLLRHGKSEIARRLIPLL